MLFGPCTDASAPFLSGVSQLCSGGAGFVSAVMATLAAGAKTAPAKTLRGDVPVVVGYTGAVYLENPPAGARIVVPLASGQCTAVLPDTLPERGWIDLGVLPCRTP